MKDIVYSPIIESVAQSLSNTTVGFADCLSETEDTPDFGHKAGNCKPYHNPLFMVSPIDCSNYNSKDKIYSLIKRTIIYATGSGPDFLLPRVGKTRSFIGGNTSPLYKNC